MSDSQVIAVLIVEDELPQAKRCETIVREAAIGAGMTHLIKRHSSVEAAQKCISDDFCPNLVILDHGLAGIDSGAVFLQGLIEARRVCRVIVLSSRLMQRGVSNQEIWATYRGLMTQADAAGISIQIEICEKAARDDARARIAQAVADFAAPIPKGRGIRQRAFDGVIAHSPAMAELMAMIQRFLEQWQRGERNLLVLHGERGAGKRFLALRIGEATGIEGITAKYRTEELLLKTPVAWENALLSLSSKSFKAGEERFEWTPPGKNSQMWSQIIGEMSGWAEFRRVIPVLVEKIADHPKHLFIWTCESAFWIDLRDELEQSLQRVMTIARVPTLLEREADIVPLAEHMCGEINPERRITLGETAKSALRQSRLTSASALRSALNVAVKKLPGGAKQITAAHLPTAIAIPSAKEPLI